MLCVHCCIGDSVVCSLLHRGLCYVFTVAYIGDCVVC